MDYFDDDWDVDEVGYDDKERDDYVIDDVRDSHDDVEFGDDGSLLLPLR